jgi:hypothetical protein
MRGRSRRVPFAGIRPAGTYPPVLCPVLALVLVAESDSRRWWDGAPTAKTERGEESRRWRDGGDKLH